MKLPRIPFAVHIRSGRYYRVHQNQWKGLTRVDEGLGALEARCADLHSTIPAQAHTMPGAVADYIKHRAPQLTPAVRNESERMFGKVAKAFADFTVAQVRPRHALEFLAMFKGPRARQAYKHALSAFFSWAVVQELADTNPLREITVKAPPKHITPWNDDLFLAVAGHLHGMLLCYHWLTYYLCQRAHDVRLLERSQVQGDMLRITPSKTARTTAKTVDIRITPAVRLWLNRAAEESLRMGTRTCPLIIHTAAGTAYSKTGIYSAYRKADIAIHGKATGLNPRDLRSYASTKYMQAAGDMRQLNRRLAHSSMSTTEGYIHNHSVPVSEFELPAPEKK